MTGKKGYRRLALIVGCLAAAMLLLGVPGVLLAATADKPLPAFMLEEIGTRKYIPLDQTFAGKPCVFFLMTTNCTTCRTKAGMLAPITREFAGRVSFVMISGDENAGESIPRLKEIYELPFTFLADPFFRFGKYYGYTYTPVTIVVDAAGKTVLSQDGYKPEDATTLRAAIESLLK